MDQRRLLELAGVQLTESKYDYKEAVDKIVEVIVSSFPMDEVKDKAALDKMEVFEYIMGTAQQIAVEKIGLNKWK